MALKFSRLESFRTLKRIGQIGVYQGPKVLQIWPISLLSPNISLVSLKTCSNYFLFRILIPTNNIMFRALKLSNLENFRALKLSNLESFRTLKSSNLSNKFQGPKSLQSGEFQGPKSLQSGDGNYINILSNLFNFNNLLNNSHLLKHLKQFLNILSNLFNAFY